MTTHESRPRPHARHGLFVLTGAVTLALVACGGSGPPPSPSQPSWVMHAPQGASGTVTAVSSSNVEVQNQQSVQVTVNFNSSTAFTNTVTASLPSVKVGSCVMVTPAATSSSTLTAKAVTISAPTANGCTRAGGFGGGGFGSADRNHQAPPSGQPNASRRGVSGSVAAVNGNTFTVKNTGPAGGNTTVTVNFATTYSETVTASSKALAVGECVVALGPADDTGAVTAQSIAISSPGSNGCSAPGFGGTGPNGGGNT